MADHFQKRAQKDSRDSTIARLKEMSADEENTSVEEIIEFIKEQKAKTGFTVDELAPMVWEGLMSGKDWSNRADQVEGQALREIAEITPILETVCANPKSEIALINAIQVFCYDEARLMKAFPNILKVLYNKDVISDQAILYWAQKGAKPQGKAQFLKATEPLVKVRMRWDREASKVIVRKTDVLMFCNF